MDGCYIEDASAVVLAGGKSSRMGRPKAFVEVGGETVLSRQLRVLRGLFREIVIVTNEPGGYSGLGARVVPDAPEFGAGHGPLVGIYTGLKAVTASRAFVTACDMPFIRPELIRYLAGRGSGYDAAVLLMNGRPEPLFGFYARGAADAAGELCASGERSAGALLGRLNVRFVTEEEAGLYDPGLASLLNLNTPLDIGRAERLGGKAGR